MKWIHVWFALALVGVGGVQASPLPPLLRSTPPVVKTSRHAPHLPLVNLVPLAALPALTAPAAKLVASWGLSAQYTKHLLVEGMPILGSVRVADAAIREAAYLIRKVIGHRPELLRELAKRHVRFVVMAATERTTDVPEFADLTPKSYWDQRVRGLGATPTRPAVACGEENLLNHDGDPYVAENILIHELAHALRLGMTTLDPTFNVRLQAAFDHARREKLWAGTYAMSNADEYWAEAAQSWFDTNRRDDLEHGPIATRTQLKQYDPAVAKLLLEVYGDRAYRYQRLDQRAAVDVTHLADFDRRQVAKFVWPRSAPETTAMVELTLNPCGPELPATPRRTTAATTIVFANDRATDVEVLWVSPDGHRRRYATVRPGHTHVQATNEGHVWMVREGATDLGVVYAAAAAGRVRIR